MTAHRSGSSRSSWCVWCTVWLCGAVRTTSGRLAGLAGHLGEDVAAYSSSSAIEYDSVGSSVNGCGTT
ncbi:MAG: hypothetical protein P0Y60_03190 [Candidatus Microbacterium colombiense]|nr:MAG: hypothetical protein P0Y60_03190 [Microbacterium sp.]